MPSEVPIAAMLSEKDFGPFHELISDPRTSADGAHAWLTDHGYRVARSTTASYLNRIRSRAMFSSSETADSAA